MSMDFNSRERSEKGLFCCRGAVAISVGICFITIQIQTSQLSLTADPIVQMVMKADHVTEQQLMELIDGTLSKLAAGSETER
jgi:hypothetical protein